MDNNLPVHEESSISIDHHQPNRPQADLDQQQLVLDHRRRPRPLPIVVHPSLLIPEDRRLEDLTAWLGRGNGLHYLPFGENVHYLEALDRQREHLDYQHKIHRQMFALDIANSVKERQMRCQQLKQWRQHSINLIVAKSPLLLSSFASEETDNEENYSLVRIMDVPLEPLAAVCDTIYAWAMNTVPAEPIVAEANNDAVTECYVSTVTPMTTASRLALTEVTPTLRSCFAFHLDRFGQPSVLLFLELANMCFRQRAEWPIDDSLDDNEMKLECFLAEQIREKLLHHQDLVVDCCQIAHYLQCVKIVDVTTDILTEAVDSVNCLALCQLADQLNLSKLFERSLSHMTRTLGTIQDDPDLWEGITPELRERIATILKAIQSSVHSSYGTRCNLALTSLDEYLAIFAEQVQYYRERLAEAQEQHLARELEIRQQIATKQARKIRCLPPNDWEMYVTYAVQNDHGWKDTKQKIDRQEKRLQTLDSVLQEQIRVFGSSQPKCGATRQR
jgi:hypothetical protein